MESPVRLRAAATFPGAPPHLLARTTLPFARSELSFPGRALDAGKLSPRRAGRARFKLTPQYCLCAVPLRSWFGNLDG